MQEINIYRDHNFQIVCSVGLIVMMTVAAIVPAFPKIVEAFEINKQTVGLLITAFSLPCFLFAPLGGIIADRLGRKRLLVSSLLLSGIFGGACAFAPDFKSLVILRILHGVAGAPLPSISLTIISDLFSGTKRNEAIGFNNSVMYMGYIMYPILGGALAGIAWNYPFLLFPLSIPLGVVALTSLHCPESKNVQSLRDYLEGTLHYLKSWKVVWLFSATMITYILLFGGFFIYFTILLGSRFHAHPLTIGLFISMIGLVTAITSSQVGRLSKRFSTVSLIVGAFVIYAFAMAMVPVMPRLWLCLLPTIFFGIAHGLNLPSLAVMASQITPLEHRAGFMAIQGTMIPLGMTVAAPIMGLFFNLTNLNNTFFIAALIALIIPLMAIFIENKDQPAS
jgi:ACDE family multidrug resistance protein